MKNNSSDYNFGIISFNQFNYKSKSIPNRDQKRSVRLRSQFLSILYKLSSFAGLKIIKSLKNFPALHFVINKRTHTNLLPYSKY